MSVKFSRYNREVKNNSPWIHQLNKERKPIKLGSDIEIDVAIVGGGIAGVSTAFFTLRNTDKKVALFEGNRLGHGATGHNAGQITSYFERPLIELVNEFGLKQATEGQHSIEMAWELLDEIYTEAGLDIPLARFTGYDGLSTFEQIILELKERVLRKQGGLPITPVFIAENIESKDNIPEEFVGFYSLVPQEEILKKLETNDVGFIALIESHKGVMNSALFTEEVAMYLLDKYKDRFSIFENTKVPKLVLKEDHALLDAEHHCVTAKEVVLCTNGFENIKIFNTSGLEIDTRFHHSVHGVVGRMTGYVENTTKSPIAINYYMGPQWNFDDMGEPYYYLTRRTYEFNNNEHSLTCLGGPQQMIPSRAEYRADFDYPDEIEPTADKFLHKLYNIDQSKNIDYKFNWHGLMGYTTNGVRMVGRDPKNSVLLYNLGCNGVGILPSIFGGEKVSRVIKGEKFPPSIFDVRSN